MQAAPHRHREGVGGRTGSRRHRGARRVLTTGGKQEAAGEDRAGESKAHGETGAEPTFGPGRWSKTVRPR